jgi:murein DD-endopeptidase MepM/ murein hydrolase activator NlpD
MNVRRASVMLRHAAPPAAVLSYVAALLTIVVLAVLLSVGARRVMEPWTSVDSSLAPPPTLAPSAAAAAARNARASSVQAARRGQPVPVQPVDLPPALEELRRRRLSLPVNGIRVEQLVPTFDEARGDRAHEAIDIMSPRGTPVVATEDGRIAKLFWSKAGGHTIYQFDPSERYVYYYAHLDRYADGLAEGQAVVRGQTIGYVGSTGNAKADAPHLHFAIFLLTPDKRWWDGAALDPYPVLRWNIDGGTP